MSCCSIACFRSVYVGKLSNLFAVIALNTVLSLSLFRLRPSTVGTSPPPDPSTVGSSTLRQPLLELALRQIPPLLEVAPPPDPSTVGSSTSARSLPLLELALRQIPPLLELALRQIPPLLEVAPARSLHCWN